MKLAPFDVTNENYNLGHLCLDSLRSRPNAVCQVGVIFLFVLLGDLTFMLFFQSSESKYQYL